MIVRCKNCGGRYWETTDLYNPDEIPDGSMLRLRQPWLGNRWPIFGDGILPKADGSGLACIKPSEMDCPGCLAGIIYNGQIIVELDPVEVIEAVELESAEVVEVIVEDLKPVVEPINRQEIELMKDEIKSNISRAKSRRIGK